MNSHNCKNEKNNNYTYLVLKENLRRQTNY